MTPLRKVHGAEIVHAFAFAFVRRTAPVLAVLAAGGLMESAAACEPGEIGRAEVAQAIDGRTLRLADGREVRLAGLAPWPAGREALARLAVGRSVTLRGSDMPDRYGRQTLFVAADGTGRSVQAALLAAGEAVASGLVAEPGCAAELAAQEAVARAVRRGVWSDPAAIKNARRPQEVLAKLGQFAIVEGEVQSVRVAGATVYVNFGRRWTRDFAVTIPKSAVAGFTAARLAPVTLARRRVRVRGIVARRGGPRIEAVRAGQIELADAPERRERR